MQPASHSRSSSASAQQLSGMGAAEQPRSAQLPVQPSPPPIQSHYELEFENPSSTWARKLFADAERMSRNMDDEFAGNGKGACRRSKARSTSHNTTRTASSHSQRSPHHSPTGASFNSPYHTPSPSQSSALGTYTNRAIQSSPEREKRKSREEVALLDRVPEDGDAMEFHPESVSQSSSRPVIAQADSEYDRLDRITSPAVGSASHYLGGQSLTGDDEEEEEEEQWILDEELARQGLYRGSYRQLVGLYSLTPLFTFLVFLFLTLLPAIAYPTADATPNAPYHYSPLLPFPLPEILIAMAFWALCYFLHSPIYSIVSSTLSNFPTLALFLASLVQCSIGLVLRVIAVPILLVPRGAIFDHPTWRDISFLRTWWIALGWAAAEAIVGVKQGYDGIALYQDVLVSVRRVVSTPRSQKQQNVAMSGYGSVNRETPTRTTSGPREQVDVERRPLLDRQSSVTSSVAPHSDGNLKNALEAEVERDVDELIALRGREELEDLYGMPFIHIPVFISCLHRLNSAIFILGSTLLLTAAYMRSSLSLGPPNPPEKTWTRPRNDTQLLITFPFLVILAWILSLLHTPQVLPRIGIQTFVYIGLMISLGVFFAGLGVWEGIV